ncbi:MAG: glycosyltransferase family A protein [Trueperaceae bacterium]
MSGRGPAGEERDRAGFDGRTAEPRVGIVLPTFRRREMLERAVETILAQTYRNWELLVVDDNDPASEHRRQTEEYMKRLAGDPRIVYLKHERNSGGAAARNTGIRQSTGEYVAFLDDDDEWAPVKLERQIDVFGSAPGDVALVYCGYRKVNVANGRSSVVLPSPRRHSHAALLKTNGVGTTSAVLCRRQALLDVGMFDTELRSRQDVDLYVRLARSYRFAFVAEPLVTWYRHAGDAIGKNRRGSIEAHSLFLRKHRAELERNPGSHSQRLLQLGVLLLAERRLSEAREHFRRAWLIWPFNLSALGWGLLANRPGYDIYRWLLSLKGRYRALSSQSREMA